MRTWLAMILFAIARTIRNTDEEQIAACASPVSLIQSLDDIRYELNRSEDSLRQVSPKATLSGPGVPVARHPRTKPGLGGPVAPAVVAPAGTTRRKKTPAVIRPPERSAPPAGLHLRTRYQMLPFTSGHTSLYNFLVLNGKKIDDYDTFIQQLIQMRGGKREGLDGDTLSRFISTYTKRFYYVRGDLDPRNAFAALKPSDSEVMFQFWNIQFRGAAQQHWVLVGGQTMYDPWKDIPPAPGIPNPPRLMNRPSFLSHAAKFLHDSWGQLRVFEMISVVMPPMPLRAQLAGLFGITPGGPAPKLDPVLGQQLRAMETQRLSPLDFIVTEVCKAQDPNAMEKAVSLDRGPHPMIISKAMDVMEFRSLLERMQYPAHFRPNNQNLDAATEAGFDTTRQDMVVYWLVEVAARPIRRWVVRYDQWVYAPFLLQNSPLVPVRQFQKAEIMVRDVYGNTVIREEVVSTKCPWTGTLKDIVHSAGEIGRDAKMQAMQAAAGLGVV
eukprot:TRINITY_DN4671_c0_g2_i1.p1 TRINITY_DN4671_c0_g2~~TRINITY_DN4671_c0_g2_i1.p1  ORF type:complete len:496 (-),score=9.68 TRINITY_DN4671_c0_g2_i1:73-1560(-)